MSRNRKIGIGVGCGVLVLVVWCALWLWPGWLRGNGDGNGDGKPPVTVVTPPAPAPAPVVTPEPPAPVGPAKRGGRVKAVNGGAAKKGGSEAAVNDSKDAMKAAGRPQPEPAQPAIVEVVDGKVCARTAGYRYAKVAFYGGYGVCLEESIRYVDLDKDGCANVPDSLPAECRWFNLVTNDGKWAMVTRTSVVRGAKVVRETQGPFAGAHAYALQ